jgi:hypothetical protein
MARHNFDETKKARRYVARVAAKLLDVTVSGGHEWLYDGADEPTVRRREIALRRLVDRLRREADND